LRRDFPALTQFASGLAILAALTVWILLLLPGLLAAALLLAGLLTRVLILLARLLVRIGHSESPFALLGIQRRDNGQGQIWFPKTSGSSTIIEWQRFVATVAGEPA
jgi:hypothetical protein